MAEPGSYTVSVQPDGQEIQVSGRANLLQVLESEGILLRADCGGVGRCGRCLVAVSSGNGSLQKTRLSPACTVSVDQDLAVTIPPASRYPIETGSKSLDERALHDFLMAGAKSGRTAASGYGLAGRPEGTLLIDMGTNGELLLKGKAGCVATSCATGPALEGSNLNCGMPAIPGAIDHIRLSGRGDLRVRRHQCPGRISSGRNRSAEWGLQP